MASVAAPLPIFYNCDVHNFYLKQKNEFHFNQKSDNEFLMFLLDTAVRVISIVQHLAPVIEAVSDAGADADDIEDEISPIHTPNTSVNVSSGAMDVEEIQQRPPPLSAELEQINQEITNAQISSQQLPRVPSIPIRRPAPKPAPVVPTLSLVSAPASEPEVMQTAAQPTAPMPSTSHIDTSHIDTSHTPTMTSHIDTSYTSTMTSHVDTEYTSTSHTSAPLAPNVPDIQLPSSAQSSENISTSLPTATQPIAEPPAPDDSQSQPQTFKTEQPIPEVIEIKEELSEAHQSGSSSELLSQDTLQQLMSSISGTEDNVGIPNFVPTATPSSLPPSFLDRGGNNPLSMLGSLNPGEAPGPSGLNVPNISESMMKNINDAGLNVSSIKGQANPNFKEGPKVRCPICLMDFKGTVRSYAVRSMKRHVREVHQQIKEARCDVCGKYYSRKSTVDTHKAKVHAESSAKHEQFS